MLFTVAFGSDDFVYLSFFNETVSKMLPGYRIPVESDLGYYWKEKESFVYKSEDNDGNSKAPYWTKGYFNNDKAIDFAYILINKNDKLKYPYAFISTNEGNYQTLQLDGPVEFDMGIATQDAGNIITASGKGYWEPTPDDPPEVTVKYQAIAYFMFESAGSIFIWNEDSKTFKRHWTSD